MRDILKDLADLTEAADEKFNSDEVIRALNPENFDVEGEEAEMLEQLRNRIYQSYPDMVSFNDIKEISNEPVFHQYGSNVASEALYFLSAAGIDMAPSGLAENEMTSDEILELIEKEYSLEPTAQNPSAAYDAIAEWLTTHNLMDKYDDVVAAYEGRDKILEGSTSISKAVSELYDWLNDFVQDSSVDLHEIASGIDEAAYEFDMHPERLIAAFQAKYKMTPIQWAEAYFDTGGAVNESLNELYPNSITVSNGDDTAQFYADELVGLMPALETIQSDWDQKVKEEFERVGISSFDDLPINALDRLLNYAKEIVRVERLQKAFDPADFHTESADDNIRFEINDEAALDAVMNQFGNRIEWDGDELVTDETTFNLIDELCFQMGATADEVGAIQEETPEDLKTDEFSYATIDELASESTKNEAVTELKAVIERNPDYGSVRQAAIEIASEFGMGDTELLDAFKEIHGYSPLDESGETDADDMQEISRMLELAGTPVTEETHTS